MKKTVIALCASLLVNLINPAGLKAWGWTELVVSNGKKQAEMIQAEQTGERDSLSVQVQAPCAVLMEASTGQTIYEKNADERRSPASITKIMTLILIFDAIDAGKIRLSDEVVTSAHAKSMGGSQVFLEEGETQTVETLIKCIVIASGNDASVAMAEYISGTEEAFVQQMNKRAEGLGMTGTHFVDCCGLTESPEHLTTARDIAIMSRQLLGHDRIREYTTIWMDTIRDGAFGLSNTNKLVRFYSGTTGLKTGFTSSAGYCMSATAERDGMELIAAVMHCESSTDRFESAKALLDYGFAAYTLVSPLGDEAISPVPVTLGTEETVTAVPQNDAPVLLAKESAAAVERTVQLAPKVSAPVEQGQVLGSVTLKTGDSVLAEVPLVAERGVKKLTWGQIMLRMMAALWMAE